MPLVRGGEYDEATGQVVGSGGWNAKSEGGFLQRLIFGLLLVIVLVFIALKKWVFYLHICFVVAFSLFLL